MKTARELATAAIGAETAAATLPRGAPTSTRLRISAWAASILGATIVLIRPLVSLVTYAANSDLFSYILLVPFVTAYLLVLRRHALPTRYQTSIAGSITLAVLAATALAAGAYWRASLSPNDYLSLMALGYVGLVAASGFLFLGRRWMSAAAFPIAFLIFLAPLPDAAVHWLETASVLGSTDMAELFFNATGTPLLRDGTVLGLPGITLRVAEECSGIRSSWILFITSLIASNLFLTSPWRRLVLVAFVIPLAIVRNGFRILVIGLLCVQIGPHMIDSVIHHRGGPIFFALSLIPLFALLWWLRRSESPARPTVPGKGR